MPLQRPADLTPFLVRPSPQELRDTHILFHARHAGLISPVRIAQFGYPVIYQDFLLKTMRGLGFRVTSWNEVESILDPLDFDFVFSINAQRPYEGHELLAPTVAALRGVPFMGPPGPMRGLAEDKVIAKFLAAALGFAVAEHRVLHPLDPGMEDFSLPGRWIVKPRGGAYSDSILLAEDAASWRKAMLEAANPAHEGRDFLAEAFVPGLNLAVPVIEGLPERSLPVFIEHGRSGDNVLDQQGKLGQSESYEAEPYDGPGSEAALEAAARMAAEVTPFDYARFDFRYDPQADRLVFLEVNLLCALGPPSVAARAAAMHGIDYASLIGHVVTRSLRRQRMEL